MHGVDLLLNVQIAVKFFAKDNIGMEINHQKIMLSGELINFDIKLETRKRNLKRIWLNIEHFGE